MPGTERPQGVSGRSGCEIGLLLARFILLMRPGGEKEGTRGGLAVSRATMLALGLVGLLSCTDARGTAGFIPSSIFPLPPSASRPTPGSGGGFFSASFPSLHARSVRLSATAKDKLGQMVGAVPSYFAEKVFTRMDEAYLKRCLFLPGPRNPDPAKADALVVLFPGIGLAPIQYTEVARAIQDEALTTYNQSLYVVVVKFFNNLGYLPKEPERRMTSIITDLESQGMPPGKPVVVIGHSGGAFLAYDAALTKSQAYVHMGSTLNSKGILPWKPRSLLEYPKPLLTLLAEMDGYIRVTAGSLEYDVMEKQRAKPGFEVLELEKPVVVLRGVSHEQFADGTQTSVARMSGRRDLAPYASLREAWQSTARVVAAFLAVNLHPANPPAAAVKVLKEAHQDTGKLVGPYLQQLEAEAEEEFIRYVQSEVASVEGLDPSSAISAVIYTKKPEFIYSKPTITDNKRIQVQVYKDTQDTIKTGFTKQASSGLWLKMKRQEAVASALGSQPSKPAATAQELNRRTLDWALERVSPEARERYEKYGRKLIFLSDDEITPERGGGPGWVAAPLQVLVDKASDLRTATLQSPVLYTKLDTLPRFAGMCYMKVLSRAQALEWVLHDAFIPMP